MQVVITAGQDTPAYATAVISVAPDATDQQIVEAAKSAVESLVDNLIFDPSYDWSGLRLVEIAKEDGTVVAGDIPIDPSGEDLGLVTQNVLSGACGIAALEQEAERQGLRVDSRTSQALDLAAKFRQAMSGLPEIPEFKPFTLMVEAFSVDSDGACPRAMRLEVNHDLLSFIAHVSARLKAAGVRTGVVYGPTGVWRGNTYLNMGNTDVVVMPDERLDDGEFMDDATFSWRSQPRHASYVCETRGVTLRDVLEFANNPASRIDGYLMRDGVLYYAGSDVEDFVEMCLEDAEVPDEDAGITEDDFED